MSTSVEALTRAQQAHLVGQVMDNERIARACGVGLIELQVLHLLVLRPDVRTARALVRVTGLAHSSVGDSVDRLVRAGYVARERDTGDRRVVNLLPTERVAEIAERYAASPLLDRMERALEGMDDRDVAAVLRYFERLNALRAEAEG